MKRSRNYEKVLDYIKLNLTNGTLKPGDRLWTVAALADQMGFGHASVREAYRILELMGVLDITPGRGTFISNGYHGAVEGFAKIEKATFQQLIEARLIIEPELAALAAVRATEQEITQILESARDLERCHWESLDSSDIEVTFHELIHHAAHNPIILHLISCIKEQIQADWKTMSRMDGNIEKTIAYHQLIAYSIKERNPQEARYLMRQHLSNVQDFVQCEAEQVAGEYNQLLVDLTAP